MIREQQPGISLFAIGIIGLGILSVIRRDFAFVWQPVPAFHPGRDVLAVVCGLFMITAGIALLFRSTAPVAIRALFPFLLAWLCLKIPPLISAPQIEAVWLGFGEIAMLFAGGWVLFARLSRLENAASFRHITGDRGVRIAAIFFGLWLVPVGLSHLFYVDATAKLVPPWMPFRTGFAYLTGIGQMACGLGILFSVLPRAAAFIETGILTLFAFLVWGPQRWVVPDPKTPVMHVVSRFGLTSFFITWVIGASALLIATNIASNRRGRLKSKTMKPATAQMT